MKEQIKTDQNYKDQSAMSLIFNSLRELRLYLQMKFLYHSKNHFLNDLLKNKTY